MICAIICMLCCGNSLIAGEVITITAFDHESRREELALESELISKFWQHLIACLSRSSFFILHPQSFEKNLPPKFIPTKGISYIFIARKFDPPKDIRTYHHLRIKFSRWRSINSLHSGSSLMTGSPIAWFLLAAEVSSKLLSGELAEDDKHLAVIKLKGQK